MSALYIVIYFLGWALLHTALASLRVKRLAGRLFGDRAKRWYRLGFVVTAVLTLIPLLLLLLRLPDTLLYSVSTPWRWMMNAGQAAGVVLLAWTILSTDALEFIGIRQLGGSSSGRETTLTTRGLYRYSRHPMYFSSMMIMWLTPSMSRNVLLLFTCMSLYFIIGSYHEEMLLEKHFGEPYRRYRKKVPRIFPGVPFPP